MNDEQLWADVAKEIGAWRVSPPLSDIAPHVERVIELVRKADHAATVAEPDAEAVERIRLLAKSCLADAFSMGSGEIEVLNTGKHLVAMAEQIAIAAMPSGRDAEWLDDALDSVHPECRVERTIRVAPNLWDVRIAWPLEPISEPHQESVWDRQEGTGTTRREAILDAVQKAKESER